MKKLSVAVGSYEKDGQQKTKWLNIGIINISQNGKEYMLLDTTVCLAGILLKQNAKSLAEGKQPSENVMVNIFDENQGNQGFNQPQGSNQQAFKPQQNQQQPPQATNRPQGVGSGGFDEFDDGIPF